MAICETMADSLRKSAQCSSQSVALYYFDTEWTYADLMDRVERVAGSLQKIGVRVGDRVAVMLQNMPASVVMHFAIWALGGIVVPVNVMLQPAEISQQLRDCGAKIFVALNSVADRIMQIVDLDESLNVVLVHDRQDFTGVAPGWLPEDDMALLREKTVWWYHDFLDEPRLQASEWYAGRGLDVALLTYTSGTTGSPKGAMNTHGHMLHNVEVYREMVPFSDTTVNIAFAPLFHITGVVAGLALAVVLAGPLVLMYRFDPVVAVSAIQRRRVTFTVGAITTYLGILGLPDLDQYDLSSFVAAYSGGAPVAVATVQAFEERTGVYIHNVYGLTESTNGLVMVPWRDRAPIDQESGALAVSKAGNGIDAKLFPLADDGSTDVPIGHLGELALRGASIIDTYWRRPEANQQSFRDGWFLTGDVARITADGWIFIVDRKKDVIVSAGNKIWPRDVEDALYRHPGVVEAVVVGLPDAYRGEAVTAFVVRADAYRDMDAEQLTLFLRQHIAAYKVPRAVHWVDNIPKTATGKFLRRAFRPPQGDYLD